MATDLLTETDQFAGWFNWDRSPSTVAVRLLNAIGHFEQSDIRAKGVPRTPAASAAVGCLKRLKTVQPRLLRNCNGKCDEQATLSMI
jgi:hypothetical protein